MHTLWPGSTSRSKLNISGRHSSGGLKGAGDAKPGDSSPSSPLSPSSSSPPSSPSPLSHSITTIDTNPPPSPHCLAPASPPPPLISASTAHPDPRTPPARNSAYSDSSAHHYVSASPTPAYSYSYSPSINGTAAAAAAATSAAAAAAAGRDAPLVAQPQHQTKERRLRRADIGLAIDDTSHYTTSTTLQLSSPTVNSSYSRSGDAIGVLSPARRSSGGISSGHVGVASSGRSNPAVQRAEARVAKLLATTTTTTASNMSTSSPSRTTASERIANASRSIKPDLPARPSASTTTTSTTSTTSTTATSGGTRDYNPEYTAKRLEELRVRRAESAAESFADYKARREARENKTPALTADYADYSSNSSRSARLAASTTSPSKTSYSTDNTTASASGQSSKTSTLSAGFTGFEDDDCIGFATLPDQVHRKAIKRGFDFTLMVVGESGLGKSTLVSSLFLKDDLYSDRKIPSVEERVNKTIEIEKHYLEIEERGVKLRLTIVDTPGFNDSLTGNDCYQPVVDYIEQQFDQYFKDESGLNRRNIKDNRVHCCLYFISPFGHGLRQMDIQFMKRMHGLVNIVPIIAKADSLVPTELNKLKHTVLDQIEKNHIRIYEFPECDSDEDEEFKTMDKELKASVPFAIIGSNYIADVNGKKVRARLYPWGIVEVENNNHCDFTKLRQMLISTHMQDLKDITRDIHYENFRAKYIKQQMSREQRERGMTPDLVIASMNASDSKLKRDSMVESDTDRLLQAKDEELERMRAMLSKMQQQLTKKTTAVNGLGNL